MKKFSLFATAAVLAACTTAAFAADDPASVTQTVNFSVPTINQIAVTDTAISLDIAVPDAGDDLVAVSKTSNFSVTTNKTAKRITASINSDMPAGLTLTLGAGALTATSGYKGSAGTPSDATALSTASFDLVTGISKIAGTASLAYTLAATLQANPTAQFRTVTLTLID